MQVRLFCLAVICGILTLSVPAGAVNYTVTDLGTLKGGTESYAYGVNNTGQVVGTSYLSSGYRAFLYDNGTMTDLNSLLAASSFTGTNVEARGINNMGQIVDDATIGGQKHAVLLRPDSAPHLLLQLMR